MADKEFNGVINLDVRDSVPDWSPYELPRAQEGAPNVLVVLYDDTGMATWSPYGGRVNMPTLQRLADNGLTYTQWHTTALCSPTRSCLLTGRNHTTNRVASIMEATNGFPGQAGRIPEECATIGHILQDNGYSTFWLGKNHNVPEEDNSAGASRKQWPLQQGFDRFYGFLGGETNNWYPDLVEDNHYIDQPYTPDEGYHLSKDLADRAIKMLRDQKASNPSKPWYMWFCPGANHAPHHAPQDYIDKYKGVFDDGYDAYREWVLARMIERGVLPEGTELTPGTPWPRIRPTRPTMSRRGMSSAMTRSDSSPGWRRSSPASASTPTRRSAGSSTTWRRPVSSRTRSSSTAPTTAPRARDRTPVRSTRTSSSTTTPMTSPRTSQCWTSSVRRRRTTTIRPAGRPPSARRSRCSSGTASTPAARATR